MRASDVYIGIVESMRMRASDPKNEFRGLKDLDNYALHTFTTFNDYILWKPMIFPVHYYWDYFHQPFHCGVTEQVPVQYYSFKMVDIDVDKLQRLLIYLWLVALPTMICGVWQVNDILFDMVHSKMWMPNVLIYHSLLENWQLKNYKSESLCPFSFHFHCGVVTPYGDRDLDQHWLR